MFENGGYTREQIIGIRYRILFMKRVPQKLPSREEHKHNHSKDEKHKLELDLEKLGDLVDILIPCLKSNLSQQDQLSYELQVMRYYFPKEYKAKLDKADVTIDELINLYPFFVDFIPTTAVLRELVSRMLMIENIDEDLWQDYKKTFVRHKDVDGNIIKECDEYNPYPHSNAFHEIGLDIPTHKYISNISA